MDRIIIMDKNRVSGILASFVYLRIHVPWQFAKKMLFSVKLILVLVFLILVLVLVRLTEAYIISTYHKRINVLK